MHGQTLIKYAKQFPELKNFDSLYLRRLIQVKIAIQPTESFSADLKASFRRSLTLQAGSVSLPASCVHICTVTTAT
jgi:hypothetical protein